MIGQKIVGMQGFDEVVCHRVFWKVSKVAGYNHVATSDYRCGENMAVIGVGKIEPRNQRLVSGNEEVWCGRVHESASAFQG